MPIEYALDEVAENLQLVTYPIIQDIIMDTAPIMHDLDTGKVSKLLKRPKYLGLNDLVLDAHEARLALDYLQDFEMGYASDGDGNITRVPNAVYENKLKFREKYPRLYKGIAIAAFMLTLGLAAAAPVSAFGSGDTSNFASATGKITEKHYDNGLDGVKGTSDDGMVLNLDEPMFTTFDILINSHRHNTYRIGTDFGANLTFLDDTLKAGEAVKLDYVYAGDEPYKVMNMKILSDAEWNAHVKNGETGRDVTVCSFSALIFGPIGILWWLLSSESREKKRKEKSEAKKSADLNAGVIEDLAQKYK